MGSSPTRPTCALIQEAIDETTTALAAVGVTLAPSAFLFSNDPAHTRPWNPDRATHRASDLAKAAARLGHSGGGATTLKHYADPVSEVDRRAPPTSHS